MYPMARARADRPTIEAYSALAKLTFRPRRADHVAVVFAIRGFFDLGNVVMARTLCAAGDTIVEVGANIGTESIHFSRIVGSAGRVVCFEPVPENADTLREQLRINNITNVDLRQAAVSATAGRVQFAAPQSELNSGQGRIVAGGAADEVIDVECVVLDDLVTRGEVPVPRLIVMDVQGAELFVLRGCHAVLRERRPPVILEVETDALAEHKQTPADVREFFDTVGYRCWQVGKWGLSPARPTEFQFGNWLALPARNDERADDVARRVHAAIRRAALLPLIRGLNPAVIE
jgi:FkbM family methyltransferase